MFKSFVGFLAVLAIAFVQIEAIYEVGGPIETITAANFDSVVMTSNKPFIIAIHRLTCGFSKAFEPVYKQVAQTLAGGQYRLGHIDYDQNSNFVWSKFGRLLNGSIGFPTLISVPAIDKTKMCTYLARGTSNTVATVSKFITGHLTYC